LGEGAATTSHERLTAPNYHSSFVLAIFLRKLSRIAFDAAMSAVDQDADIKALIAFVFSQKP
jgi:hypothetical protein